MRCITPLTVKNSRYDKMPWLQSHVEVPCGKCPACRHRRAAAWSFRLLQQERGCASAYFVTLTYSTDNLPISDYGLMTLCPSHVTDFFKRLRYYDESKSIKYFLCGEYGTVNKRPHYHCIIFNCDADNLVKAWDKGHLDIGTVTGASINYTCGYMDKPFDVEKGSDFDDRVPEFQRMSKGLGVSYLTKDMVDWYKADLTRLYVVLPGGEKWPMPRYFRDRIFTDEEKKVIAHYLYWSQKWDDDVRPSYDQVKQMFDKYKAKYRLAVKRRL